MNYVEVTYANKLLEIIPGEALNWKGVFGAVLKHKNVIFFSLISITINNNNNLKRHTSTEPAVKLKTGALGAAPNWNGLDDILRA